eukprot:3628728-Pyramimonas_sp.AAC.1
MSARPLASSSCRVDCEGPRRQGPRPGLLFLNSNLHEVTKMTIVIGAVFLGAIGDLELGDSLLVIYTSTKCSRVSWGHEQQTINALYVVKYAEPGSHLTNV